MGPGWAAKDSIEVVLHPLRVSCTDATHERHPPLVVWGGSIVGGLLPLGALVVTRSLIPRWSYLPRFFAGFCLVVNGDSIGVGSFEGVGDSGDLSRSRTPRWQSILFGPVTVPAGLFLWHGFGPYCGLGDARGRVDRLAAVGMSVVFLAILLIETPVGSR